MMPIVDPTDKIKDVEVDVWGLMPTRINIHKPIAFSGAGLRLQKNEYIAI